MQKKIIALAIAAAFAAPAVALADVTTYGSMDGGFRHQTNDDPTAGTTDSLKMGHYNSARWGFKAVDDMGNGMKTNVVLETSLAPTGVGSNSDLNTAANPNAAASTGTAGNPFGLLFDRQATIGIESGDVKFDMGWQLSTSFKTLATYDPFAGKLLTVTGLTRKAMSLRTGGLQVNAKFGDVAVTGEYVMNDSFESRQSNYAGTGRALGVTYASGPINVGAAYSTQEANISNPATGAPVGYDNASTHITAGAGFNFGDGKVSVGYAKKATKTASTFAGNNTVTNIWLGANYNMSTSIAVTGAYYSLATNSGATNATDGTAKTLVVGVTYALSKKTLVYFEMDKTNSTGAGNTTTAGADTITNGSALGISTVF